MATANFYTKNASKYFAFEDKEDEFFDYKEFIEDLGYFFEERGFDQSANYNWCTSEDAREVATISADRQYGGVSVEIQITAILRSGYYAGACFDWIPKFCIHTQDFDEIPDETLLCELLEYYSDMPAGMAKIQARNAEKWFQRTFDSLVEETEKCMSEASDHTLVCTARFSNGEAMYSKA